MIERLAVEQQLVVPFMGEKVKRVERNGRRNDRDEPQRPPRPSRGVDDGAADRDTGDPQPAEEPDFGKTPRCSQAAKHRYL